MAGGIDWFRWHHGSVTDPKFQLIAKKAGASLPDVLAVWAYLLEQASASDVRGEYGAIDCEAVDCMFGFDDGRTAAILTAMEARVMLADGRVASWEKRQPKRERDTDSSTDRTRAYRERQKKQSDATENHVTPCDAKEHQKNARGEERRGEYLSPTGDSDNPDKPGLIDACPHQQIIDLYHELLPTGRQVREWTPARAAALRSRWRENPKRQNLDWWRRFFTHCSRSAFLTGRVTSPGRKPFEVSLDWLVKSENLAKVIEGAYHEEEREAA